MACVVLKRMDSGLERLVVWQRARRFCGSIQPVVHAAEAAHDYALAQLNGSALSIMSNIAEGHLRRARRQFAQFLAVAAGSNAEARSCLYLAWDRQYLARVEFDALRSESEEIGRMLESLRAHVVRQASNPGPL